MGKNKNIQFRSSEKAIPTKGDTEIAGENGLEKVALKAQKHQNK